MLLPPLQDMAVQGQQLTACLGRTVALKRAWPLLPFLMKPLLLSIQQGYVWTKARLYGRLWKMTGYILHRIGYRIGYIQRGTGIE